MTTAPADRALRRDDWSLRDAATLGLSLLLWILAAMFAWVHAGVQHADGWLGADVHAYWRAARSAHPYGIRPGAYDSYEYSPVFLDVMRPLGLLPFRVVYGAWMVGELAIFTWLTKGLRWRWRGPLLLTCVPQLLLGNLHGFYSLVLVFSSRFPQGWAFPLLTKITPGGVGLLWHALRREWRHVWWALVCTALISVVSVAVQPRLWLAWVDFLRHSGGGDSIAMLARSAVAVVLTVLAARHRQPWLLPWAMVIAEPVYGGVDKFLAVLPVTVYLIRHRAGAASPTVASAPNGARPCP